MVGALIWRKAYEYALVGLQKAIRMGVHAELTIVGSGPDYDHLVFTATDLHISEKVIFLGHLEPDEVLVKLQSSHILLHTAVSEGIPNALVEAMACGLPVITTNCGGIPEAVDDGVEGIFVPTRDPDAIAAALIWLAKNPELRAKMGTAGRERALRQFDLKKQAQQLYRSA